MSKNMDNLVQEEILEEIKRAALDANKIIKKIKDETNKKKLEDKRFLEKLRIAGF